jgi:hypothetical protein
MRFNGLTVIVKAGLNLITPARKDIVVVFL